MTERSRSLAIVTIAGAVFCLLFILLALQIRAGNDPSIGAGKQTAVAAPRQVIVRRIIVRRVIEDAPARASTGGSGAAAPAPAGAQPTASAPAPAAPAPAAPAPAAPAPAPAPAPVVSAAS